MLPPREKRAGMAEAVKVALIRDGKFFNWLESHVGELARFSKPHLDHLIKGCAELHMRQIGFALLMYNGDNRGRFPFGAAGGGARDEDWIWWEQTPAVGRPVCDPSQSAIATSKTS